MSRTSIVYDNVESSKMLLDLLKGALDLVGFGDVERKHKELGRRVFLSEGGEHGRLAQRGDDSLPRDEEFLE